MGRKKKNQSSRSSRSTPSSPKEPAFPCRDVLDLRLLRPSSNPGTPSRSNSGKRHRDPLVFLTEQDAGVLDVVNGDHVLLLSRSSATDGSESVKATALCEVRINPSSRVGTPSKHAGTSNLRAGNCRVTPPALAERLLSETLTSFATTPTPISSPPKTPLSSSSSKSSFSFAQSGGGDKLISPSTTPSTPSKASSFSKQILWVIPIDSSLGSKLMSSICREASSISLTPTESGMINVLDKEWSNSKSILQRIVVASSHKRYYHVDDVIASSFRGQPVDWEIQSVKERVQGVKDDSDLHASFAKLSLEDRNTELPAMEGVLAALDNGNAYHGNNKGLLLYKIDYETEILLSPDKIDHRYEADLSENGTVVQAPLVAGLDSTMDQINSLLLPPLLRPETFTKGSLRPPRGLLLHGPSGVGKSILAQQIASDLRQRGVKVTSINCTSLQSHTAIVGEAERRLTRLFRSVEKRNQEKGSLLVLDDIHLISPKRGGSSAGLDRLSATLLALLDGVGGSSNREGQERQTVVILGITTNPSLLDPALRRPGRLDAEVEVPIPDEATRASILSLQLRQISHDVAIPTLSDADVLALSRLAKGFNGADCMLAIKEALRTAMIRSSSAGSSMVEGDRNASNIQLTLQDLKSAIRSTKPSTIKSITVEIPQVRWSWIGGMDYVKEMLREAIELPLTHAHLFEALSIPPPRGVLLYGPPGCSKTLMAKALATEGHMNFLAVKGPELLSKWLGESERALASLFRRARMASPCIIFFDEIDAIASKRGGGSHSGGERLLSQLLTELDGINSTGSSSPSDAESTRENKRVIVVGATNRPDLLDSALMRPGRIDRMIYVGLPDCKSRASILEIGLRGKACCDDIDISFLASDDVTGGFSGAEMISICREAALFAIEEDDESMSSQSKNPQIQMKHLVRAIQETQRQITPEMIEFYASFRNKPST